MREVTTRQIVSRRLARSHLLRPAPRTRLVEVVRTGPLVQAQVASAAEIAIGVRVRKITAADVHRELYERRSLVKTWSIRGTLHLVPADELPMWQAAVRGTRPYWESRDWLSSHDLTRSRAIRLFDALAEALDGACLTRAELASAVSERLGRYRERLLSHWGELLRPASVMGILCFGPPRGPNVTFVRADRWIGGWVDVEARDARRTVLRRYLAAHAPATEDDFRRWSGFERSDVRGLFDDLAGELERVRVGGRRTSMLAGDDRDLEVDPRSVHLLPQYDAYIMGFRPRALLLPPVVNERIRKDPQGEVRIGERDRAAGRRRDRDRLVATAPGTRRHAHRCGARLASAARAKA